ncbi:MAG: helix-turn-helix domain-containing protein [Betaproteobacteria bacterium]
MHPDGVDPGRPLRTLDAPGFHLREALFDPGREVPPHQHAWANLCLVIEGGYRDDWGRTSVRCGPASLVFHPPDDVYGHRISGAGSRCLTMAMSPDALWDAADVMPSLARLRVSRRAAPNRLAYQLRRELELSDDLSAASAENAVLALLSDLADRPALEAHGKPPGWLERLKELIHDEFAGRHSLETFARTVGVHRVHLARAFRRHYGCTVGEYIRQLRVEFTCHRLAASGDSLSEIAFDAGFADQSHFTNTFRRLVGVTPGAFQTLLRCKTRSPCSR